MTFHWRRFLSPLVMVWGCCLAAPALAGSEDYGPLCRYFAAQAFQDRQVRGETTFRMDLAQDCLDARIYAFSDDPETRDRALAYLDLLSAYRAEIVALLLARAAEQPPSERRPRRLRPVVKPVNWVGGYLIAQRMGLVKRQEVWTLWRRSVASADPRFRLE
ncbi:MAG: hypothetical protein AAF871_15990 [Pseudomonadota bacterium]